MQRRPPRATQTGSLYPYTRLCRSKDGKAEQPVPRVRRVHGGPWARDAYGYSAYDQGLANHGYAVLSVNYRGSAGFGKDFVNKSNHEWAGKMHDDLIEIGRAHV